MLTDVQLSMAKQCEDQIEKSLEMQYAQDVEFYLVKVPIPSPDILDWLRKRFTAWDIEVGSNCLIMNCR